jgi:hypothetical protein
LERTQSRIKGLQPKKPRTRQIKVDYSPIFRFYKNISYKKALKLFAKKTKGWKWESYNEKKRELARFLKICGFFIDQQEDLFNIRVQSDKTRRVN